MTRIVVTGEEAYKPIEVELWGTLYETRDMVKSELEKVAEAEARFADAQNDDPEAAVEMLAEIFDRRLIATNGKRTKPSTKIKGLWKADKLSLAQLGKIMAQIATAESMQVQEDLNEFANSRPT